MRVLLAMFLAVGLVGCKDSPPPAPPVAAFVPPKPVPPAQNAPVCVRPPEKVAFDLSGLKSQLMVTAISCKAEDKYNAFVNRFRPDLVSGEKSLTGFFGRAYGRRAQQEHDDYITQLANAQSQLGIKSGTAFCEANLGMFDEVMALKSSAELPAFAAAKPIQQSMAVQECTNAPAPAAKPAATKKK
ncbi:hypothetical protein [Limobrevibacterium gyesilva]|uniref:Lipoprotein n=1 Tax=Limobrevibacterium gyesilva TaxID=2991712 RepID=A0AA41YR56_9PROT|nr:hypothetical protein [Limobrevibacterium gyesilva]MCW3477330.1 hypothetical protein [Limobrevibacterium gyesilva]